MNRTASGVPAASAGDAGPRNPSRGPRYLVIVARDRPDLLRHLVEALADWPDAEVLPDRRYGRRWSPSPEIQPREVERRRPVSRESDVDSRAFLIVPCEDSQP